MTQIILIRGLPGAGKSTLADNIANLGYAWWEADDYFYACGEYEFDATKLHAAHAQCLRNTRLTMLSGESVVVSNTFTTEKELKPYLALAEEYGYTVTTLIVESRHGNPSVHDVPEETMDKMRKRFSVKL